MFPSSGQLTAGIPRHWPLLHTSFAVQALWSSQGLLLSVWTHPVAGSHKSVVQGFPSSQFLAVCPRQVPVAGSHASSVQISPSLHTEVPTHWLFAQTSLNVHNDWSSHAAPFRTSKTAHTRWRQVSRVHGLLSVQGPAAPPNVNWQYPEVHW